MPILQPLLDVVGRSLSDHDDDVDHRRAVANGNSRWGVVLDAGSSGTRLHIYKWDDPVQTSKNASLTAAELHTLPKIVTDTAWTQITRPGVSSYATNPAKINDSLKGLIDNALKIIPKEQVKTTPIYLLATAGMRLLPDTQQTAIQKQICTYLKTTGFSIPNCSQQIQVIDGETEGLYGWIATNYLAGAFDHPKANNHGKGHNTYGFLDMGGASAQITFIPNKTETAKHADSENMKLLRIRTLDGQQTEHNVFSKTWLGFGVNQAFEAHVKKLVGTTDPKTTKKIPNPCAPKGLLTTTTGDLANSTTKGLTLQGTGNFTGCLTHAHSLLGPCKTPACLLGPQEPAIDFDVNHFVGVSEFLYSTQGVLFNSTKGNKAYDLKTYQAQVEKLCTGNWDTILSNAKTPRAKRASQWACYKSAWLINVLHDGIGVPRVEATPNKKASQTGPFLDAFQPVASIGGVEVSWTLGPMVLYASGQVPAKNRSLPVGIEGNAVNSSSPAPVKRSVDDFKGWVDHAKPSNDPSLFIWVMILVLLFVGYIFRKRESRISLTSEIFGKQSMSYERTIEEGAQNDCLSH